MRINGFDLPPGFENRFWRTFRSGNLGFGNSLNKTPFRSYRQALDFRTFGSLFRPLSPVWASMSDTEKDKFWELNHTARGSNNWSRFIGLNASRRRSGFAFTDEHELPYFPILISEFPTSILLPSTAYFYFFREGWLNPSVVRGSVRTLQRVPFDLDHFRSFLGGSNVGFPHVRFFDGLSKESGSNDLKISFRFGLIQTGTPTQTRFTSWRYVRSSDSAPNVYVDSPRVTSTNPELGWTQGARIGFVEQSDGVRVEILDESSSPRPPVTGFFAVVFASYFVSDENSNYDPIYPRVPFHFDPFATLYPIDSTPLDVSPNLGSGWDPGNSPFSPYSFFRGDDRLLPF